jgi:hypothetical protein
MSCKGKRSLTPVIENIHLIFNRHASRFEIGNRRHNVARGHVPRRIVVKTNDQHTRVASLGRLHHLM